MVIFATIATLFVLGSLVGYIIELFFRRFVSQHKWMNPGFLVGPYLPIYGFGVLGLYGLSELFNLIPKGNLPTYLIVILEIVAIGVILTVIELIAGLIFTKWFKLKLWDYSKRKWNFKGVICPLFSLIWTAVGCIYFFFIHQYLRDAVYFLADTSHTVYYLFTGIVLGMIIVDFFYSVHLATLIRKTVQNKKEIFNFEIFKIFLREDDKEKKKKGSFFFIKNESFKQRINEFREKIKRKDDGQQ